MPYAVLTNTAYPGCMDPISLVTQRLFPAKPATTILELDLDLGALSSPPTQPLAALRALNSPNMRALLAGLRAGAADPRVVGLIVHVGTCPLTPVALDELCGALEAFALAKPIVAYTESFGELGNATFAYRIATRAGEIWMQPSGELGLSGVGLSVMLLRGGLDKLGIEPEFGQRHEFKTAADQFTAREITPAHREMIQRVADALVEDTVDRVANARGLTREQVWDVVNGPSLTAAEALARGFVDRLGYRDEVYQHVRQLWGADAGLKYAHRYAKRPNLVSGLTERGKPVVAIVPVLGGIVAGRPKPSPGGQNIGSEVVGQQLRQAAADPDVKAIVLRVDSPGGSYIASDTIRRAVQVVRTGGKPVVASMGDVAASGGYFVSMAADEIVAAPSTITGSIGVLAGKFVTTELKAKLGLVIEDVAAGSWATTMSPNVRFTAEQWDALNRRLDEIYADFTQKAAADRGLSLPDLENVARGRVWTGSDAARHGLVDHLGGSELAVQRACALAGLDRDTITIRGVSRLPFLDQLRPAESSEAPPVAATALSWGESLSTNPDQFVRVVGSVLGIEIPGVLTLPFRFDFH